jgi:Fe2+ or Zn2+ uptake regulation protein
LLFEQLGLVRRVPGTTRPAVFDTRTDDHHHAVCEGCGRIATCTLSRTSPRAAGRRRRRLRTLARAVVVDGRCAACAARA